MTMNRKTALKVLQDNFEMAAEANNRMPTPGCGRFVDALEFAIKYLDDFDEKSIDEAHAHIEDAITSKNPADLARETLEQAATALFVYRRDRYEYADPKPVICAVCHGIHWPMDATRETTQGCDCAAYVFTKYDRNFLLAAYGSERDSDLYEFVLPMPDEWKDQDPVCDNCIQRALRNGLLAKIPGDYPFGLVRYRDNTISEETAEPFEPPKLSPPGRAIAEARRYYSDYLRGLEKNIAEYRATAVSTQAWVTPEVDAETRRNADGQADHLHGHAVLAQTALDALDAREREVDFHHWCGDDEGLQRIREAHAVFKAIADSEQPGTVERHDAYLAMTALSELARVRKGSAT